MQGMLTSINAPYVTLASNTGKEYFGEILSYTSGFTTNQYNGGIAGVQWKNAGDSTARAYGYTYDNVGRLTRADFTQQNSGATAWTNDKVDYTISALGYDAGGNILSMQQKGLLSVGGNATIDNLTYSYLANSNRLQNVSDQSSAGGGLGDFKDTTTTSGIEYVYDANGNIVKDNNRRLFNANGTTGTVFNLLDKPDSMAVAGKSCTYYTYNAAGTTLSKTVNDYKTNTAKRYTYIGGFIYLSTYILGTTPAPDTLQYAMFEEGCIRWKAPTVVGGQWSVVFDYMLKDHAGNVRTVITDEVRTDDYPAATMDNATAIKVIENAIYAGLDLTRVTKPNGYPTPDDFPIPNANNYVAKVQGDAGSQKVGPSITLKVMKGDKFDFYVSSYYQATAANAPLQNPLTDIVNGLASGVSGSSVLNTHGVTSTELQTAFTPNVTSFLNTQPPYNSGSTIPLAYVNWVLFDEQFNLVSSSSGFERVSAAGVIEPHTKQDMPITQSGYLYIYVSNTTPNIPVYFDNLKVKHIRGALLETNEYYPYGLKMASISYKASMTMTNRFGWNGGNEYEDEGELNYSNTFYRKYDAQIGRFTGVDMLAENFADLTPYQFGGNNPVMFNDPMGDKFGGKNGERLSQMNAHPISMSNWENSGSMPSNYGLYADYTAFWENFFSFANFGGSYKFTTATNKKGFEGIRFSWWEDGSSEEGFLQEVVGYSRFMLNESHFTRGASEMHAYDPNETNWAGKWDRANTFKFKDDPFLIGEKLVSKAAYGFLDGIWTAGSILKNGWRNARNIKGEHIISTYGANAAEKMRLGSAVTVLSLPLGAIGGEASIVTKQETTMLGHSADNYVQLAIDNGYNYFKVPNGAYCKPANQLFLDQAILQGDRVILSRPLNEVFRGSVFKWEIDYMLQNGYKALNSTTLIP